MRVIHELVPLLSTLAAGALGGGIFSFIQFLIERKDGKEDKLGKIIKAIEATNVELDKAKQSNLRKDADDARRRILIFADEIRRGELHSEEFFNQVLEDISFYENYCRGHPDYQNDKARDSTAMIREAYHSCRRSNNFI